MFVENNNAVKPLVFLSEDLTYCYANYENIPVYTEKRSINIYGGLEVPFFLVTERVVLVITPIIVRRCLNEGSHES